MNWRSTFIARCRECGHRERLPLDSSCSAPSRRSANIAEGCGKRSDAEFARYIDIALGSAKETENHLIFAVDMGWISLEEHSDLDTKLTELRRMLFALSRVMRERVAASAPHRSVDAGRHALSPERGAGGHER